MGKTRQTGNLVSENLIVPNTTKDTIQVGSAISMYGQTGIISAYRFYGDGSFLTGIQVDGGGGGGVSPSFSLTVKNTDTNGGAELLSVSDVSTLVFDNATGFVVTDNGSGEVFIELASSFAPWYVQGQDTLDPQGEESIEIIAGPGITLATKATATGDGIGLSKALTIGFDQNTSNIVFPTADGGGAGGSFDTSLSATEYYSVSGGIGTNVSNNNNIFIGPADAKTFPSTSGNRYIIDSVHVTNKSLGDLYLNCLYEDSGTLIPITNRVLVPYQGSIELIEQPHVLYPSSKIRLQALSGTGLEETGQDAALDAFITYSTKQSTSYFSVGITSITTDTECYSAVSGADMIQSIYVSNYDNGSDVDVSVSIFRSGSIGSISDTGIRVGYLAYNLTIPKNSSVEILQRPKHLAQGYSILVSASKANSTSLHLSGRSI